MGARNKKEEAERKVPYAEIVGVLNAYVVLAKRGELTADQILRIINVAEPHGQLRPAIERIIDIASNKLLENAPKSGINSRKMQNEAAQIKKLYVHLKKR